MRAKRKLAARAGGVRSSKRFKNLDQQPVQIWHGKSGWQDPEHPVLENILEYLLSLPNGKRWVRVASHVCSFWRAAAQDVLLADTAVSKPERPPMPEAPSQAYTKPSDTVQTQAAVVLEASNSTGFEAVSKQHPDNPPVSWPIPPNLHGPAQVGRRAQPRPQRARRANAQAVAARAPGGAAAAAGQAAGPAHPAYAAGGQQGSIESGMAVRQAPMSDSESDGSTGVRQPLPAGRGRGRGRMSGGRGRGRSSHRQLYEEAWGQLPGAQAGALDAGHAQGGAPAGAAAAAAQPADGAAAALGANADWPGGAHNAPGPAQPLRRRRLARRQSAEHSGRQQQPSSRAAGRPGLRSQARRDSGAAAVEEQGLSGESGPAGRTGGGRGGAQRPAVQQPWLEVEGGVGEAQARTGRRGRKAQQASDVAAVMSGGTDSESDVEMPARAPQQQQQQQQQQEEPEVQQRAQQKQAGEQQQQAQQEVALGGAAPTDGAAQHGGIGRLPRYLANFLPSFARPRWAAQWNGPGAMQD